MSAMAYTTKRGKTKRQKESIRKDAKNNAATKLMSTIKKEAPKKQEEAKEIVDFTKKVMGLTSGAEKRKAIQGPGSSDATQSSSGERQISTEEAISQSLQKLKIYVPTYQRCFNTECVNYSTNPTDFKLCGRCRIARYCSQDCQRADWKQIHKESCGNTQTVAQVGSSVAIKADESRQFPSHYPSEKCKAPANELHGVITSLSPIKIELFSSDLLPTSSVLEDIPLDQIVVTQWNLNEEKKFQNEKKKHIEERKLDERRKIERQIEQKRMDEEKQKRKEERARKLLEERSNKNGSQPSSGDVPVDWSLFTEQDLEDMSSGDEEEDSEEAEDE